MRLFDDVTREYAGPACYAEPAFVYLNRSARPAAQSVRHSLEDWFSRYPSAARPDLHGRFRSNNDIHHLSSFFELLLHEILVRMGCRVELHPITGNDTQRQPDFLVESPKGHCYYLEAVVASAKSQESAAARARMNEVYDALNRLESPNFFIWMDIGGAPEAPPPAGKIRAFLKTRLEMLDPDEVSDIWRSQGIDALPCWQYEYEGWRIDFLPIPKSPDARGKSGIRPIGGVSHESRWVDSSTPLRDAIIGKAGRYGHLELPYVIAVNTLDDSIVDQIDVMDALFGAAQHTITLGTSSISEPEITRAPNGVWTSVSGPRYTRVSAVLIAVRITPWTVGTAGVRLVHNPWAQKVYSSELTCFPEAIPQHGKMEWQDGVTPADILDLPPGWPVASADGGRR